ncbi:armadillo-type protein [Radiomyces spectabilis]|uniref:armadillo-type protein n=1 Tax=Radiomyces spectabilis TaxID=64574 RepID=UPI00221FF5B7|nr:armadillo-type protein [Radiomyces spectabilis]KAI8376491.1 armadillo-type protein [Radiomyces spectabilis]
MSGDSVAQVLTALSALYSTGDPKSKREASRWLENFQKQPEAWSVADYLLNSTDSNLESRLFAAQTFRQKITYDLCELDAAARNSLRASLLQLLWLSTSGPKALMIQLCLAVADLAIQLVDWKTPIQDIFGKFGETVETAPCVLEFLKVLPEEMSGNSRLPLSDKEFKDRSVTLIENNAVEVLKLLLIYMETNAGNVEIQISALRCLSSWLRTGDIDINVLSNSPLLNLAFEALLQDDLFDVAVDVVCEIIYETRDVMEYKGIIEKIYPRLTPMLGALKKAKEEEDTDMVRGFCRMYIEAGEAYVSLIAQHQESFIPILDGICECTAYSDLDIAQMTFKFWYELTNTLTTSHYEGAISSFQSYFDRLVDIIIDHLHYPEDVTEWSATERDDFRDFRHEMGDTLKDCCRILGPQKCLAKPMNRLAALLQNADQASWQQIEAPIFSLRAMGSEVPVTEGEVMPQIMEFLSKLPDHPKIRYAATLVISRYSLWTRHHPQFITYQLNFISAGFQNDEVAAASALALKHLCKDCSNLLVDYIGQLHLFYVNVIKSLPFIDAREVTEAVAHVLAVLPVAELQNALQLFCMPLAQDLHTLLSRGKSNLSQDDCVRAGDTLEEIGAFFEIIHPDIPLGQPHPCVSFFGELWPVFDLCLSSYGDESTLCEPLCKIFRSCVQSYNVHFVSMLPQLMERIITGFEQNGLSVYIWAAGRVVREYAVEGTEAVGPCFNFLERLSNAVFSKINGRKFDDIPDVIEDYFRLVTSFLDRAPTSLVQSSLLPLIFQAGLAGLSLEEEKALTAVITFYRRLFGIALSVDELVTPDTARSAAAIGQNGSRIVTLIREYGRNYVMLLFNGLIYHYHWDMIPDVASSLKSLAQLLPAESAQWIVGIMDSLPEQNLPTLEKNEFLENYMSAVQSKQWTKVRRILTDFVTAYRRKNAHRTRK